MTAVICDHLPPEYRGQFLRLLDFAEIALPFLRDPKATVEDIDRQGALLDQIRAEVRDRELSEQEANGARFRDRS